MKHRTRVSWPITGFQTVVMAENNENDVMRF